MDQTTMACGGTDDKEEKRTKIGAWTSVDICLSVCVMHSLSCSSRLFLRNVALSIGFLRLIFESEQKKQGQLTSSRGHCPEFLGCSFTYICLSFLGIFISLFFSFITSSSLTHPHHLTPNPPHTSINMDKFKEVTQQPSLVPWSHG